ncbi:IS5/IS1182 family transposase, partial [Candidatus Poribacteria bacterium]|nr:IS5/IS1182 family transposase [Candidatus Poribacteria bacterium]
EPKSNAGRKPFDVRLRFQIMILDSCYNLSYHQLEFQIQDRISFLSVLALSLDDTLPEAKTIWLFNLQLTPAGRSKKLFQPRDQFRPQTGFSAQKGKMVAASMVAVPRQPNTREK